MDLRQRIDQLVAGLSPDRHAAEIAQLRACKSLPDLDRLAERSQGWLTAEGIRQRLRLVRHGSGTFLVVEYTDGWTKTLSRA
jgi:hypothetical protein